MKGDYPFRLKLQTEQRFAMGRNVKDDTCRFQYFQSIHNRKYLLLFYCLHRLITPFDLLPLLGSPGRCIGHDSVYDIRFRECDHFISLESLMHMFLWWCSSILYLQVSLGDPFRDSAEDSVNNPNGLLLWLGLQRW